MSEQQFGPDLEADISEDASPEEPQRDDWPDYQMTGGSEHETLPRSRSVGPDFEPARFAERRRERLRRQEELRSSEENKEAE